MGFLVALVAICASLYIQETYAMDGDVTLLNYINTNTYEGVVKIEYAGKFRSICDDSWDYNEARIVCEQLGHKAAETSAVLLGTIRYNVSYNPEKDNFLLKNLVCGNENANLLSCSMSGDTQRDAITGCYEYEQAAVRCDPDMCNPSPCVRGDCTETTGIDPDYTCTCPLAPNSGWEGKNCESDINECDSNPCVNGACTNTDGSYICVCTLGWTGSACDVDIDECETGADCCNVTYGATCTNKLNKAPDNVPYKCNCRPGWTGDCCDEDVNECITYGVDCEHAGSCVNNMGSFSCSCVPEWTGDLCATDVDECALDTHLCNRNNYNYCTNIDGGYTCSCRTGWTGTYCESDYDECTYGGHLCPVGSTCTNTPDGSYTCVCANGYQGLLCNEDILECGADGIAATHKCENSATCVETSPYYTCTCAPGWTGDLCETDINECTVPTSNLCASTPQTVCTNTPGSYTCTCGPYHTGTYCDVEKDLCALLQCDHGTCSVTNYVATCTCEPGWYGELCNNDVLECQIASNCVHGVCTEQLGSYLCVCDPAESWSGTKCDQNINECLALTSKCITAGTALCVDDPTGGYTCTCKTGWSGTYCDSPNIPIRLSNGNEGHLEVYKDGVWGYVCPDYWDIKDATVVCRFLGYSEAYPRSYDLNRRYLMTLSLSECVGTETSFLDCPNQYISTGAGCGSTYLVAGAYCSNPVVCPRTDTRSRSASNDYLTMDWSGQMLSNYYRARNLYLTNHMVAAQVKTITCYVHDWLNNLNMAFFQAVQMIGNTCNTQVMLNNVLPLDDTKTLDCSSQTGIATIHRQTFNITFTKTDDNAWDRFCILLKHTSYGLDVWCDGS